MEKIRRILAILIAAMMTATPFMSFATEEGSFGAPENGSAATVANEAYDAAGTAKAAEDAEAAAPDSEASDTDGEETAPDSKASVTDNEAADTDSEETAPGSEASVTDNKAAVPDNEETAPETAEDPGMLPDEPTKVTVVSSVEELLEESEAAYDNDAFFTIDASKDDSAELATDEVSGDVTDILSGSGNASEKQDEIVSTLEDSGLYRAEEAGKSKVEVTSKFAYQRLRLTAPQKAKINAHGAVSAVYFGDSYQLSYDSMEATMLAYDALTAEYGNDAVLIDMPMRADSGEYGWGTSYMGMSYHKTLPANKGPVMVAVLDTGIERSHPIFSGRTILRGKDLINNDSDPADDNGHGTAVSGIIAESTPANVSILPIKVLDNKGDGSTLDILNAVNFADSCGADIINMSVGGYLNNEKDLDYCEKLISGCSALIICSSGNENKNMDAPGVAEVPGELSATVCIGAITKEGKRASFSNYGYAVDFAAPGSDVLAASLNGTYRTVSGTSFSSPYVAAAAAIVKARNTGYNRRQIKRALRNITIDLGDQGKDVYFGSGCPKFIGDTGYTCSVNISDSGVSTRIQGVSDRTYNGYAQIQDPFVIVNDELLRQGTDYEIRYLNNVDVGTASLTIAGRGDFSGEISGISFRIAPKQIVPDIRLSNTSCAWNGREQTPSAAVYDGDVRLPESQYIVTYPEGRKSIGAYSVSVTLRGNYTGQGTAGFRIVPKGTKIKKLKGSKKALTVRWVKQKKKMGKSRISGYQVQVATDRKFKKNSKTAIVKGYKKTAKKFKKLRAKKKYYVRVRTYKTVGGKKYYSAWSGSKTVRTK